MSNAFNLPSLFFGIYLIIPLILGCFLLFGVHIKRGSLTKAQRLGGVLLITDAVYLIVRTMLLAKEGMTDPILRRDFFILDSTVITMFALIPYTVITERYPKWWMILLSMLPIVLIPTVTFIGKEVLAIWSHMLPITAAIFVLILSVKQAHKADQNLLDKFADPETHSKSWIINLNIGFLFVTIASMLRYVFHGYVWYNIIVSCLWSLMIIAIYLFLLRQQSSLPTLFLSAEEKTASKENKTRNSEGIRLALEKNCVQEKLYLKADLSIDTLALACETNRTYLSYYLHDYLHQNFYEYINTLRIAHVEELLKNSKLSLESIALQCGYNSARTMRSAYAKVKGVEMTRRQ